MKKQLLEFSKKVIVAMLILFGVAMIMTYVFVAVRPEIATQFVNIFTTVATLVGSCVLGYESKACVENYSKIKASFVAPVVTDEEEDTNG